MRDVHGRLSSACEQGAKSFGRGSQRAVSFWMQYMAENKNSKNSYPTLGIARSIYTHSPPRITGSALPEAVMPSMSSLFDPIIQST